jgi:hypothetical protein
MGSRPVQPDCPRQVGGCRSTAGDQPEGGPGEGQGCQRTLSPADILEILEEDEAALLRQMLQLSEDERERIARAIRQPNWYDPIGMHKKVSGE